MPTTTPLTDAIEALTTYSNTVTGASDTTLSEAVATLAAGYGGGGGIESVHGTATITLPNTMITHNAGYDNYLWHAWIDSYSTLTGSNNNAIEYWGFFVSDFNNPIMPMTVTEAGKVPAMALRYNPSTGAYTNSVSASGTGTGWEKTKNQCPIGGGCGYSPHTAHTWHWECINLAGLSRS